MIEGHKAVIIIYSLENNKILPFEHSQSTFQKSSTTKVNNINQHILITSIYPFNNQFHTFSGLKKCRFPMFYSSPANVCVQPPRPDSFAVIDLSQPPMPDSFLVILPPPPLKRSAVPPTLCQPLTSFCGGEAYGLPDHPALHMTSDIQSRPPLSLTILLSAGCPA